VTTRGQEEECGEEQARRGESHAGPIPVREIASNTAAAKTSRREGDVPDPPWEAVFAVGRRW
jgi:hypothetical protein